MNYLIYFKGRNFAEEIFAEFNSADFGPIREIRLFFSLSEKKELKHARNFFP